jgi:ribulose-5-phosphate 4-epimerase/fuculose-1-phosphate aldolase
MADGAVNTASLQASVSPEEWRARVELAALYRLVALHGWDDLIYTHISARVPGPEHHFLINPYGVHFGEMTASALVKIDLEGAQVQPGEQVPVNAAGFTIHSALHQAREDARFVMHLHTDAGVAVAAQKHGLLPISQFALIALPRLAYHDYESIAFNLDERERLVADMGDKDMMLLRNHGTLAIGGTAGDCWTWMYFLERACKIQVLALSTGRDGLIDCTEQSLAEVKVQTSWGVGGFLAWPGCLRRLDRESPGYDL